MAIWAVEPRILDSSLVYFGHFLTEFGRVDLPCSWTFRICPNIRKSPSWDFPYSSIQIQAYYKHIYILEVIALQNNNRKKNNEAATQDNNPVSQAAALAVIAGLITTLGDGLSTVAAALAIQEAQQQGNNSGNNNGNNSAELQQMQQQLDYLTKEVKRLKRY
jgi:hypothetical protein